MIICRRSLTTGCRYTCSPAPLITVYAQVRAGLLLDHSNGCSYRGWGGGRGPAVVERPLGAHRAAARAALPRARKQRPALAGRGPGRRQRRPTQSWRFAREPDALDWVQHLQATDGGDGWRPITLTRHQQSG